MRIRVLLNGDFAAPAEIDQMETLIQEAGRQAIRTSVEQHQTSHGNKLSTFWRTNAPGSTTISNGKNKAIRLPILVEREVAWVIHRRMK